MRECGLYQARADTNLRENSAASKEHPLLGKQWYFFPGSTVDSLLKQLYNASQ